MEELSAISKHNPDNFLIGFFHSVLAKTAYVLKGGFYALCNNTVSAMELLAVFVHVVAQNSGVNGRSDFGGTGGFGAVADNTGYDGKGIDNGVGNIFVAASAQVCDSGSGSGSGADSSAVGRKTSDGGFLVNGSQVGKGEGPVKLLLAAA